MRDAPHADTAAQVEEGITLVDLVCRGANRFGGACCLRARSPFPQNRRRETRKSFSVPQRLTGQAGD